jgi:hypothetical protein
LTLRLEGCENSKVALATAVGPFSS